MSSQPMLWGRDPDESPRDAYADDFAAYEVSPAPPPKVNTTGRIAEILGVPVHRIVWILKTRPDIQPTAYAGKTRLYDNDALARIRHEINAVAARRTQHYTGGHNQ